MPITKSAKKKVRADERKRVINLRIRRSYKRALKIARENPNKKNINQAYSKLDIAAKKRVVSKNKASRLKSRLAKKLLKPKIKNQK